MIEREGYPPEEEQEMSVEWMQTMGEGVSDALDLYDEVFDRRVDVSPVTLTMGLDERGFDELSESEREYVKSLLQELTGWDPNSEGVKSYDFDFEKESQEGKRDYEVESKANVTVYRTDRSESEGIFVHVIEYPDGDRAYILAGEDVKV